MTLLLSGGLAGPAWGAAVTAFTYPDFSAPTGLAFFNAAAPVAGVAQLTPAAPGRNGSVIASSAVALRDGFDTEFQFRILNPSGTPDADGVPGGDGFALIIQKQGPTATGPTVGYIPYSIPNAVALEFDTWRNSNLADPDGNHLSVQDVGPTPNGLAEFHHNRSLGWAAAGLNLSDGAVHTAHVRYRPGLLQVFLDGAATPTLSATLDLSNIGGRSPLLADGSAWLSFAAGTGTAYQGHEILSWSFQAVVPVVNHLPVANAGGPYTLDAGSSLTLNGSGTDADAGDSLAFAWDLNNDGTYGDASGATPTLSPAALAALGLGNGAHTIFLRVTDTAGASTTVSSALTIRATQTIAFDPVADRVFGDAPFAVRATASSGLPVTFTSLTPGVATVSGNTVTLVGAGTATLRASQAGDANWQPAANADRTFTVRNESGVWAWGNGDSGQLGNGQTGNSTVPGAVWAPPTWYGRRVLSVAPGLSHCLALLDDGRVWAWGNGADGQLGNGRTLDWSTPMAVIIPVGWTGHKVVSVAAGRSHSLALLDDGSIWAWGDGSAGQLGDGQAGRFYSSNLPVAVSAPVEWNGRKVLNIAAGGFNSLALLDDGSVWAWGHGGSGELGNGQLVDSSVPVPVSVPAEWNGHRVLGVAAGSNHSLAVVDDGSVWAWGRGLFGSLGNGQIGASPLPVAVSTPPAWAGRRVVSVAAGDQHSLAVLDDGSTWAWGDGSSGQLGNGQTGASSVPVVVSAPAEWNGHKVVGIAAGSIHSLAILDDGSLWSWGEGLDGQLGDDRSLSSLSPVAVAAPAAWTGYRVVSVTAGANYSLALLGEPNTAPNLANPVPSQVATYGTPFTLLVPANTFADPDAGQTLSWSASGLPAWLAFDANTRTFSGTPTGLGSFTVTVTATDDGTPALSASTTFDLVVGKAPLTATGDTLYRFYGEENPPLTGTLVGVVNGDNITASYTTTATPTGAAGVYTIYVTLNDPDSRLGNYEVTLVTGALRVERAPQTIAFGVIPPHVFGDAPFTVPVSASSGLPVTLTSSAASVATVSGTTLTITGAGATLLTAYQPGDGNFQAAAFVQVSYSVGKATPVITWATPAPITSSTPLSAAQLNATADVPGSFAYTPTAGTTLPRGTHVLSAGFTPGDAANYTSASATVSLEVLNSAPVAVADNLVVAEDRWLNLADVLANDTDPDGDTLSVIEVRAPSHGNFGDAGGGVFAYFPSPNFVGADSFRYIVGDGHGGTATNFAYITVTSVNDAPTVAQTLASQTGTVGTAFSLALPAGLFADVDAGTVLTETVTGLPAGLAFNAATRTIAGVPATVGSFTLTVTATDNGVPPLSASTSFSLAVAKGTPVITWATPADISCRTPLGSTQLNATANTAGTLTYDPPTGTTLPLGEGQVLAVSFTPADPVNWNAATATTTIGVRLHPGAPPGQLDSSFNAGAEGYQLRMIAPQPNGKVVVCGWLTSFNGVRRNEVARLNADGSLDLDFDPGSGLTGGNVDAVALQADGKVLIGGNFSAINGMSRRGIARVNDDGTVDASFNPGTGADSGVLSMAVQPDGKVVIGGWFTSVNGVSRSRIARLNSDGSVDTGFNPGTGVGDNYVWRVAVQPDGKILLAGAFTTVNGVNRNRIARLNSDGTLDTGFDVGTGANQDVYAVAVQPDGKVLVGGVFTSVNGSSRSRLARLNEDGSVDTDFSPNVAGPVFSVVLQPDGRMLVGGNMGSVNGVDRMRVARILADGSVDPAFDPLTGPDNQVRSLALQPDGKLLIGGDFGSVNGIERKLLARLEVGPEAPTVTVNGSAAVTLELGTPFADPGATALDACGSELSVSINGTVNINAAGDYTLTYTATDAVGQTATAKRTVSVIITDHPPVAVAGPDQQVVAGTDCLATVAVDGGASSDPDGDALGFSWQLFRGGELIDAVTGQAAVSWSLTHGTYEAVLTVSTDKNGTTVSRSDSLVIAVLPSAPALAALSPASAYEGGPGFNLTVTGGCFLPGAVVHWNGSARPTTVVSGGELSAAIPAADLLTGVDIAVASVTVVNGDGQVSNPLGFSIAAQTVGTADAAVALPGTTASASTAPTTAGEPGVSVTVNNGGTQPVSVLAATYDSKPVGETAFRVDNGAFVDVQVAGANQNVAATVWFYYPSTVTGGAENRVKLRYFNGTDWIAVRSSGGAAPIKNTTDNLDGTVSGGRFEAVFDATSTPTIMELGGTVFGLFESAPQIQAVTGPVVAAELGDAVNVGVDFAVVGDPAAAQVQFLWDDGTETTVGAQAPGHAEATHLFAAPGVYGVTVRVSDAEGDVGEGRFHYVVICDPNGGAVAGAGWIELPDDDRGGRRRSRNRGFFEFNARYQRGRPAPVGQAFFRADELRFQATGVEWLVVAGNRAQVRGTGKLNGQGHYGFLLTASNGKRHSREADEFRIKIWDPANGTVVYDNRPGTSDDLDEADPQPIGGGEIVLQRGK